MDHENLQVSTNVWFRTSTNEWVIDFDVRYPDVITSSSRFTGKTQLEALESMRKYVNGELDYIINSVKHDMIMKDM